MAVIVAGGLNMDVVAYAPRIPLPGETIAGTELGFFPGGKGGNQSVASALCGSETRMVGCVGRDDFGERLVEFLSYNKVDVSQVISMPDIRTGAALIFVGESGENSIVILPGANAHLSPKNVVGLCETGDVALAQFEIPISTLSAFFESAKQNGAKTIFNPAPFQPFDFLELIDILVLNETENEMLIQSTSKNSRPNEWLIVTQGERGATVYSDEITAQVDARHVNVVDTTGAGDCFVGTLAAMINRKESFQDSVLFASAAATLSTTKHGAGTSMPSYEEVVNFASIEKKGWTIL